MADTLDTLSSLDTELEIIAASLLPEEALFSSSSSSFPREISIANGTSLRTLHITVREGYPALEAVSVELKGNDFGRDAAAEWNANIRGYLGEWDTAEE